MTYNKRHAFSLSTHQFRLRHVEGVSVRCLEKAARTCISLERAHVDGTQGTEGTEGKRAVMFRSGPHHVSSNPSWKLPSPIHLSDSDMILKVEDPDTGRLLIEHYITLGALSYHGDKIARDLQTNTVLVLINDTYFTSKYGRYPEIGSNVPVSEQETRKPFCTVRAADTKISYDTKTVQDLHGLCAAVESARDQHASLRRQVADLSSPHDKLAINCRIKSLRDKLAKYSQHLSIERERLAKTRESHEMRMSGRDAAKELLIQDTGQLNQLLDSSEWKFRFVARSKGRLLKRQDKLMKQLGAVFHISRETIVSTNVFSVEKITDKACEEEVGAGLGYTAHLVALLSSLLNLPLRFPVTPHCSMSSIRDDITPRLDEKRVLPLYVKGKDRSYFCYGVFLLHRNIAQLRHLCGIPTQEIKQPLNNLSVLMSSRLATASWSKPVAQVALNDKIISKLRHNPGKSSRKTHKRVQSAPIKYTVNTDLARSCRSNVPSEASWSSGGSVTMAGDVSSSGESFFNSSLHEGLSDETQAGPSAATSSEEQLGVNGEGPPSADPSRASGEGPISDDPSRASGEGPIIDQLGATEDQLGGGKENTLLSPELVEIQIVSSPTTDPETNSPSDLIDLTEGCGPCSVLTEASCTDAERPPEEHLPTGPGERAAVIKQVSTQQVAKLNHVALEHPILHQPSQNPTDATLQQPANCPADTNLHKPSLYPSRAISSRASEPYNSIEILRTPYEGGSDGILSPDEKPSLAEPRRLFSNPVSNVTSIDPSRSVQTYHPPDMCPTEDYRNEVTKHR